MFTIEVAATRRPPAQQLAYPPVTIAHRSFREKPCFPASVPRHRYTDFLSPNNSVSARCAKYKQIRTDKKDCRQKIYAVNHLSATIILVALIRRATFQPRNILSPQSIPSGQNGQNL